jgi:hypothetical protein
MGLLMRALADFGRRLLDAVKRLPGVVRRRKQAREDDPITKWPDVSG